MKTIKITKKLNPANAQSLRRKARFYLDTENVFDRAFTHVGRNEYAPLHDEIDEKQVSHLHSVARHMMVVVGTTFEYEIQ